GRAMNGVTGQPAAGAQLRIVPTEWTATVVAPSATADPAGNFDIAGVTPGSHVLYASMTMADPNAPAPNPAAPPTPPIQLTARVPFDMSNASLDNAGLILLAGATISGKLVQDGIAASSVPRGITVTLARDPDLVGAPAPNSRGAVQPEGTLTLQGVGPRVYRVIGTPLLNPFQWGIANAPQQLQNLYVKSIRVGGNDVLNEGLTVPAGGSPGDLEIVLGNGGRLEGQAVNDNHEPVRNVTVALVPDVA